MKSKKARKILIFSLILVFTAAIGVGTIFAYFARSHSGWKQQITTTNIIFRYDGKTVGETVDDAVLELSRGEIKDVTLQFSAVCVTNTVLEAAYTVNFTLEGDNNELARAVEVYMLQGGEYSLLGTVEQLQTQTISGVIALDKSNEELFSYHYLKFAYPETAGDYYENKGFTLSVSATCEIVRENDTYLFARNFAELEEIAALSAEAVRGKTVYLINDIALENNIAFAAEVGLELAGNTLNLNEYTFTINCTSSPKNLMISDSGNGGIDNSGGGKLNISCAAGLLPVQDSLADKVTVTSFDFTALADYLKQTAAEHEKLLIAATDSVDITTNVKPYLSGVTLELSDALSGLTLSGGIISPKSATNYTVIYSGSIYLTKGVDADGIAYSLRVRGNSPGAIAQAVLNDIFGTSGEVLNSVFLPDYDPVTGMRFSWVSDNASLLSEEGIFLANFEMLESWAKQSFRFGVTVGSGTSQAGAFVELTAVPLTAAQRTERIYDYSQMIFEQDGQTIDFSNYIDAQLKNKSALTAVNITFANQTQNINADGQPYLEISDGSLPTITAVNRPVTDRVQKIELNIEFVYSDGVTHSEQRVAVVTGYRADGDVTDIATDIQQQFIDNIYVGGDGFNFYTDGATSRGVYIEYSTDKPYILINNGIYQQSADGNFMLLGGEYHSFYRRYNLVDGNYEIATDGDYVLIGENYYSLTANAENIYARKSYFGLIPASVPAYDEIAEITAQLIDENGNYLNGDDGLPITYRFTMQVYGIYHNTADEIADRSVYETLLAHYDLNNNGFIEVREAQSEWYNGTTQLLKGTLSTDAYRLGLKYIDISSKNVTTLKGLEYFTGAQGFDLSGNSLIGLGEISELYSLKYLDLSANNVSSLGDLAYLDALEYLDVSSNKVLDIEPIRYLPNIKYALLNWNDGITDFSPLENYSQLQRLDVRQTTDDNTNTPAAKYVFALLHSKNANATVYASISGLPMVFSNELTLAALAISRFQIIDGIYTTIYAPSEYYYNGETYYLSWRTYGADTNYLTFNVDETGKTVGYTIVNPVADRDITITLFIKKHNGDWTATEISRRFTVKLFRNQSEGVYIEKTQNNYEIAQTEVTDSVLLENLIDTYGTEASGGFNNVFTYEKLTTGTPADLNLSGANVQSLAGLSNFAGLLQGSTLNLGNMVLTDADYAELKKLTGLGKLIISGQRVDFSKLLDSTESSSGETVWSTPFTALTSLDVSGCYDLDDEDVLRELYRVYFYNRSLTVYKDGADIAWNPYAETLARYAQALPSAHAFNDYQEQWLLGGMEFTVNFYGVNELAFSAASVSFEGTGASTYFESGTTVGTLMIRYKLFTAQDRVFYCAMNLTADENRGEGSVINYTHYAELIAFTPEIVVTGDGGFTSTLSEIFPGFDLRQAVLGKLSVSDNTAKSTTLATIGAFTFSGNSITVSGNHNDGGDAIKGLKYLTTVRTLTLSRDADIGDGSELVNLTTLNIGYSYVDFSSITVTLGNIRTIRLGKVFNSGTITNRFVALENLDKFPNITHFYAIDNNIYDWSGLAGLAEAKNLKTLAIFATTSTHSNKNANYKDTVAIINTFYNIQPERFDETVNFYIGTLADSTSTDRYEPSAWDSIEGATSFTPVALTEYNNLANGVKDLGLSIKRTRNNVTTQTLYFNDRNDTVIAGDTINLPRSTRELFFGTDYPTESEYFDRDFIIDWAVAGVREGEVESLFGTGSKSLFLNFESLGYMQIQKKMPAARLNRAHDAASLSIAKTDGDFYCVFIGTIGRGYWLKNADGTYTDVDFNVSGQNFVYSFTYGVLISGTGANAGEVPAGGVCSYAVITDPALRYHAYLAYSAYALTQDINSTISYITTSHQKNRIFNINFNDNSYKVTGKSGTAVNLSVEFERTNYYTKLVLTPLQNRVVSLDGLHWLLNSVTSLELTNGNVVDIDGICPEGTTNTVLQKVIFSSNLITDVEVLSRCSALTSVNLSSNPVKSLRTANEVSVLAASAANGNLNTLNLRHVTNVCADDMFAFANSISAEKPLSTLSLDLYGVGINYNYEMMKAMYALADGKVTQLTLAAHGINSYTVTADQLSKFIAACETLRPTGSATKTLGDVLFGGQSINVYYDNRTSWPNDIVMSGGAFTYTVDGITLKCSVLSFFWLEFVNAKTKTGGKISNVPLTVVLDGSSVFAEFYVTLEYITAAGDSRSNYYLQASASTPTSLSDLVTFYDAAGNPQFDPGIWANCTVGNISKKPLTVGGYSYEYIELDGPTFSPKGRSIRTLKGVNLLKQITEINATDNNNKITGLWEGEFTRLTSLTLAGTMNAAALAPILGCPNLVTLDLSRVKGIDYFEEITYNGQTTTLAAFINSLTGLTTLKINNAMNWSAYDSHSAFNNYQAYFNGNSKLFGIEGGKNLSSFTALELLNYRVEAYSGGSSSLTPIDVNYLPYAMYFDENGALKIGGGMFGKYGFANETYNLVHNEFLDITNMRTTLMPNTLSSDTFDQGVTFYLPGYVYIFGQRVRFTWAMYSGDTAYITQSGDGYVFHINSENYKNEDSVTLRAWAYFDGITEHISAASYAITIKKAPTLISPTDVRAPFYLQLTEGGEYVDAFSVIDSNNLVHDLFNTNAASVKNFRKAVTVGGISGTAIEVYNITTLSFEEKGITSLAGLEHFVNLKQLYIGANFVTSLDPIAGLALEVFSYTNYRGNIIEDFTPLVDGSRDSLTTFAFNSHNTSGSIDFNLPDMSFLLAFNNLQSVALTGRDTATNAKYLYSPSFRYLVAALNTRSVLITVNSNLQTPFEIVNGGLYAGGDDRAAAQVLSLFKGNTSVGFEDNYRLKLSATASGAQTTYLLPAYIEFGGENYSGELYAIDWQALSGGLSMADSPYIVTLSAPITLPGSITVSNGDRIDYQTLKLLIESREFMRMRLAGNAEVHAELTVSNDLSLTDENVGLNVRIEYNGYFYERRLTLAR